MFWGVVVSEGLHADARGSPVGTVSHTRHQRSDGNQPTTVTVTVTSVTFGTNPDVVGQPTTVTVTVIDTAGAGASNPGGTASFTPTGHGSFTGTCTLTQGGAQ